VSTERNGVKQATELFDELRASGRSSEEIFVVLYSDLKQLARMKVARRRPAASMHATRLLSDLYMRLFRHQAAEFQWESARHFFNTMALAMEQLLIDHARSFARRGRDRMASLDMLAGEGFEAADAPDSPPSGRNLLQEDVERAVLVKELLDRLETETTDTAKAHLALRQAEIVRLRMFLGLGEDEVAELLGCSSETVTKEFRKAKAKLASFARQDGKVDVTQL
jgi:RNA polymerase sigma factor (sigma-70 family)